MKKILHLSHTDITYDSRILKEIKAANNKGYDVFAIGIKSKKDEIGNREPSDLNCIIPILINTRYFYLIPRHLRHLIVYLEFFIKSLKLSISYKPDIIHSNDTAVLPIALIVKLLTQSKIVYDAHELESNKNGQGKLSRYFIKNFERFAWRFIDGLIVVSPSISNWYKENIGVKPTAIVLNSPVIKNSINFNKNNYIKDTFNIPDNKKVFLYIGGLGPGRGIELIEAAFCSKKINSHVVFLGYGPYLNRLKDLSSSFSNIHVHAAVTHDKVVEIALSANVGLCLIENVSLSDYYCLPNKLFEYCFAGIPVLASNFPDISSVVSRYNLGVVTELDTESVVAAIMRFEKDEFDVHFAIENLKPLSWDTQAKNLISLYEQILNK
jgi:glycosyltransferase involved in cell wall biosynthesis